MRLEPLTDRHFAWLLGEADAPDGAPAVAAGGIAPAEIVSMMRGVADDVGGEASWLMVVDGEAVGMISVKDRDATGLWDIGYGVAESRRKRGHACAAVGALKLRAQAMGATGLTAETLCGPGESARLLQRNGFACTGQFDHPEDGLVDQWKVEWTR